MSKRFMAAVVLSLLLGATLVALCDEPADTASASRMMPDLPKIEVNDAQAAAAGIHKLSSKRLVLYTDLAINDEIRQLPQVFDQAFPQWCAYFHVDPAKHADWQMTGFLMKDKSLFERTGLLPRSLPRFLHGFSRNYGLWLYDQPSDYYRRHLLLHEGTHGFMNTMLGGCGPPWYMEGMAELLGTHRLRQGRLTLGAMPANREEVPEWGRIKIIKEAFAARRPMRLSGVLNYSTTAHLQTEPYAWCWALTSLLDGHPRYRERFRQLYQVIPRGEDVTAKFHELFDADGWELNEEWQLMVSGLEYGYDFTRTTIDFAPGRPLGSTGATVKVAADRGWQNTGLRLEAGTRYQLTASGRYQVATQPKIWWCEPGGVSIRYYQGRPLGVLLAAVRPDESAENASSALLRPSVVGLGAALTPEQTGTLYLKINDSAGELNDNAGELKVEVTRAGSTKP